MLLSQDGVDEAAEPEDEVPEPPKDPVTRPGDLWLLGEHRLLCGDATVLSDVERRARRRAGRHGLDRSALWCELRQFAQGQDCAVKHRPILNDNLGDGFEAFLTDACANLVSVTEGAIYIAMSSSELHTLQRAFAAAGGKWSTFVIWAKHTFTLGRADYQRQYEPILYGWRDGGDHYWCGARDQGDVWFFDKPAKNDLHPTMKPVALVERAIRNSSKTPRHRAGRVRRLGLDPDRGREDRPAGASDGVGPGLLRRDHPALTTVQRACRQARIGRPQL